MQHLRLWQSTVQRFANWQNIVTLNTPWAKYVLQDRLVCGIANPAVQKHLLTEPEFTFTKAVTIAQAVELAEKGLKEIQSTDKDPPKDIHKFSHATNSKNSQKHKVCNLICVGWSGSL